jgi:RNA polymerase sigma-70 factor (ECF subfamily)
MKHEASYSGEHLSSYNLSAERILSKELDTLIKESIEALPDQCRLVFGMSRFENLKYSEIAEQLGISVKTVEKHMGRALKELREKLKDYLELIILLILIN